MTSEIYKVFRYDNPVDEKGLNMAKKPVTEFGRYIDEVLKEKGWSRRRLAREANISPPHLNNIINGVDSNTGLPVNPSTVKFASIATALNIPVQDLLLRFQGIDPDRIKSKRNGTTGVYEHFFLSMAQRLEELYPDPQVREKKLHEFLQSDAVASLLQSDSSPVEKLNNG